MRMHYIVALTDNYQYKRHLVLELDLRYYKHCRFNSSRHPVTSCPSLSYPLDDCEWLMAVRLSDCDMTVVHPHHRQTSYQVSRL